MEYRVHFTLTIRSLDRSKAAFGYKKMVLPFAPFLGLRLQDKLGPSEQVVSITWSDEAQEFRCHIDSCEVEMDDGYDLDIKFLVKQAARSGWLEIDKIHDVDS